MANLHLPLLCLLAVISLLSRAIHAQKSCYARDDNPYLYFSSKTAYEFVKDKARTEEIPYCEPLQLWMISRHGTRYPTRKEIVEMKVLTEIRNQIVRNHDERHNGNLCDDDLVNLKKWSLDVSVGQDQELTNQGHMDLEFIARRYKSRFPVLLTQQYNPERFHFRHTDRQRTKASAQAFAVGLFGGAEGSIDLPEPITNDTLISSYSNCTTWQREVRENPETTMEQDLFINGSLVQNVIQNVSERLGFRYKLTMKQIDLMYDMCRYDKAWLVNELSPWCAVFTRQELQVLEYKEDLRYYYLQGYGNDMNVKLGCPPVKDLIQRFSALENKTGTEPDGVFYFTHSTAIHTTLANLGIAKDYPKLLHNNYEAMQRREWKISQIGPFASNLAAVFFRCSRGDPHRVMFFLEERIVPYDGCDVGLCSWEYIKEKLSRKSQDCNLDWCHDGANGSPLVQATTWTFVLATLLSLKNYL